jgi:hypothetical protein
LRCGSRRFTQFRARTGVLWAVVNNIPEELGAAPRSSAGARLVMVLGVTLPAAVGAGILIGMYVLAPKPKTTPPAPSVVKHEAAPPPSASAPLTVTDKAAIGDFQALDQLKAKAPEQRTPEETFALARGRSHNKSAALGGFATEIKKDGDLLKKPDQLQRLRDFLADRETATQAAEVVVSLPGTIGPDLLWETTTGKTKSETGQLAEDLLATKAVRDKASPAVLVAADLKRAESCEPAKALLPRIAEQGDRRMLPLLSKLVNKRGCGPAKTDDCYECLRPLDKDKDAVNLGKAIKAVSKRPAPKL